MLEPRGSEYPNSKVLGPKIHTLNGFWTLKTLLFGYLDPQGKYLALASVRCSQSYSTVLGLMINILPYPIIRKIPYFP